MSELIKSDSWLTANNMEQAMRIAEMLAKSTLVPKAYQGQPANVLVAMAYGDSFGMQPLQAMQSVAVVNGMPGLYGDGLLAVCKSSPEWEWMQETIEGEVATCTAKRRGEPEVTATFSVADAKRAQLWGKQGPWTQYPQRMLAMRARSFALRNLYADILRGMRSAEELDDIPAEQPAVTVEPVAIKQAPAEPASKAQAVLSKARAKRQPKPAAIPEVIEQPPHDAQEVRITVSEEALGGVREVGRKWAERYSSQHPFVSDLRATYAAMQDGILDRIKDATSAAFAQITKLDNEDQGEAADDMAAIMSAIEGASHAE
jgi:hypothetical protein